MIIRTYNQAGCLLQVPEFLLAQLGRICAMPHRSLIVAWTVVIAGVASPVSGPACAAAAQGRGIGGRQSCEG